MLRFLFIIFTLLSCKIGLSQNNTPCISDTFLKITFEPKLVGETYLPQMVGGHEFFNENYHNGDVILQNDDTATNCQLKYNGRLDELLLLVPNTGKQVLLDKYLIKEFYLKNYTETPKISFKKIRVIKEFTGDSIDIFGQLLYQNKLSIYAFRYFAFIKDIIVVMDDGHRYAKPIYGPSPCYYFQLPNHRTIGFKSFKKKELFKLFPEKVELMKKLFKEKHQRRFRRERDLIRITEILNEMY